MSCPPLETIAAYLLDELEPTDAERLEQHYFECDACLRQARNMHRLVTELGASLPPILTNARRRALEAAHPGLTRVAVNPGETATLHLSEAASYGFWIMRAPLDGVRRVDLEARDAEDRPIFTLCDVPFDADKGEVTLACQFHYRALPGGTTLHVRLTATGAAGVRPAFEYTLDHRFESL